jgi:hypothetical protein
LPLQEKGSPKEAHLVEAHLFESLRKRALRSFASCARLTGATTRTTIRASVTVMTKMVSPSVQPEVSHLTSISPTKSHSERPEKGSG